MTTAEILAEANRRFYRRCAELGIVPPIGPDGPPPRMEELEEPATAEAA